MLCVKLYWNCLSVSEESRKCGRKLLLVHCSDECGAKGDQTIYSVCNMSLKAFTYKDLNEKRIKYDFILQLGFCFFVSFK